VPRDRGAPAHLCWWHGRRRHDREVELIKQTYGKTVAIGLDDFAAATLLNRNDITISAACGLVRRGPGNYEFLQLHPWQVSLLSKIGATLEFFWPGHCEGAIANDILRGKAALITLKDQP
jgi:hypothetical protein